MLRKLGYSLFCAGALFSANVLAVTHNLTAGLSMEYELPPNEPQEFVNAWFWTITSTCTIHTHDTIDNIFVEVLKNPGKLTTLAFQKGIPS